MLWFSRGRNLLIWLFLSLLGSFPAQHVSRHCPRWLVTWTSKGSMSITKRLRRSSRSVKPPVWCRESAVPRRERRSLPQSASHTGERKLNMLSTVISLRALQNSSCPSGGWRITGRVTFYEEISAASLHPPSAHVRLTEANLWPGRRSRMDWKAAGEDMRTHSDFCPVSSNWQIQYIHVGFMCNALKYVHSLFVRAECTPSVKGVGARSTLHTARNWTI